MFPSVVEFEPLALSVDTESTVIRADATAEAVEDAGNPTTILRVLVVSLPTFTLKFANVTEAAPYRESILVDPSYSSYTNSEAETPVTVEVATTVVILESAFSDLTLNKTASA